MRYSPYDITFPAQVDSSAPRSSRGPVRAPPERSPGFSGTPKTMAPPSSPGFRAPGLGARGMLAHLSSKIGLVSERPPTSLRGKPPSAGVPPSTRAGDRERLLGTRQVGLHQGGGRAVVVNHIDAVDVDARANPSIPILNSPSELSQVGDWGGIKAKRREREGGGESKRSQQAVLTFPRLSPTLPSPSPDWRGKSRSVALFL